VKIAIVDYGSGNLRSAEKAFERSAREAEVTATISVTSDAAAVAEADKVVLPGVGAFRDCWEGLHAVPGMAEALDVAVRQRSVPFLGICVGMQLLATTGREHGDSPGFGWIPGTVEPIRPNDPELKIPHMGWNALSPPLKPHAVLAGLSAGDYCYFVHSFALEADQDDAVLARTNYGGPVTAMVGRDNIVGTQFHPEKSQQAGLRLIANFLKWDP
jgi:glutamine amidotransferase